jgi:hypothetical protein
MLIHQNYAEFRSNKIDIRGLHKLKRAYAAIRGLGIAVLQVVSFYHCCHQKLVTKTD